MKKGNNMKTKQKMKTFRELFWVVIMVAMLFGAIEFAANRYIKIWETGAVTQGIAVRTNDQVQKSVLDMMTGKGFYVVELQFDIDGTEYKKPNHKFDAKMFDQLDADDQNGQVSVEIHYEMNGDTPIYVYQGAILDNLAVIGK